MWETWVQSLGWDDPLEKGKATQSSVLACELRKNYYLSLSRSLSENEDFIIWKYFVNIVKCFQDILNNQLPVVGNFDLDKI